MDFLDYNLLATFALLIGLELVLGIDNILLISIVTDRVDAKDRNKVRIIGLGMALFARLLLLMGASYLVKLSEPVIGSYSYKSLVLLAGGAFLLYKAVKEIHHVVESKPDDLVIGKTYMTFGAAYAGYCVFD